MTNVAGVQSRPIESETRPWGSFSTLEAGPGYKVKRLVVMPGQRLSLQKHRYRSEHWVVVAGIATVVNGAATLRVAPRESVVIPRHGWHRIENRGRVPVVVIEVQHGTRLEETDIVRKEDDYGRVQGPETDSQRGGGAGGQGRGKRLTSRAQSRQSGGGVQGRTRQNARRRAVREPQAGGRP